MCTTIDNHTVHNISSIIERTLTHFPRAVDCHLHVCCVLNCINIAVMLSVPMPSSVLTAQQSSRSASTGLQTVDFSRTGAPEPDMALFKNSTHCSFVLQSQIPSHATIKNSSSCFLLTSFMSGKQVTAYCSGGKFVLSLY